MKTKNVVLMGAVILPWLAGCASSPVALAPVGPNPAGQISQNRNGQLEVFSALRWRSEGDNPAWPQHTDYDICNPQGKAVKHVANAVGHYAEAARLISLPAGKYVVKAHAKDYLWVEVPVVVEAGRITKVHLDDAWRPAADVAPTEVVCMPTGNPVGWSIDNNLK
jgi:hypothetical protein